MSLIVIDLNPNFKVLPDMISLVKTLLEGSSSPLDRRRWQQRQLRPNASLSLVHL
jgi:hypothetical protein